MRLSIITTIFVFLLSVHVIASELVIIGNVDFPMDSITPAMIKHIYTGKIRKKNKIRIKKFDLPDNNKIKKEFVTQVLGFASTMKYNSYWISKVFKEGGTPPAMRKSIAGMLEAVADVPGGIGYCTKSQAESQDGIKILYEVK